MEHFGKKGKEFDKESLQVKHSSNDEKN